MITAPITVAIITRNRINHLARCLQSISKQLVLPNEIIIINNGGTDLSSQMIKVFKRRFQIAIREIFCEKPSRPLARNVALNNATYGWVAFIDDDCVANRHWIEQLYEAIKKHPDSAAVMGYSDTIHSKNIFSSLFQFFDSFSKLSSVDKKNDRIINTEVLDTKNVALNTFVLKKHHIKFNLNRTEANEDCDLGAKIRKKQQKMYWQQAAIVYHEDPQNLWSYFKKLFQVITSYWLFKIDHRDTATWQTTLSFSNYSKKFVHKKNFSATNRFLFFLLLYLTVGIHWIADWLFEHFPFLLSQPKTHK